MLNYILAGVGILVAIMLTNVLREYKHDKVLLAIVAALGCYLYFGRDWSFSGAYFTAAFSVFALSGFFGIFPTKDGRVEAEWAAWEEKHRQWMKEHPPAESSSVGQMSDMASWVRHFGH